MEQSVTDRILQVRPVHMTSVWGLKVNSTWFPARWQEITLNQSDQLAVFVVAVVLASKERAEVKKRDCSGYAVMSLLLSRTV